jgi:hypothetical protein
MGTPGWGGKHTCRAVLHIFQGARGIVHAAADLCFCVVSCGVGVVVRAMVVGAGQGGLRERGLAGRAAG